MEEFFENLGKRIVATVDELGKKAEDTLEVQKMKNQVHTLKRANERDFVDIGKKVYEQFKAGEIVNLDFVSYCEEIEKRDESIADYEQEIERIKGV